MTLLTDWAQRNGVSPGALQELRGMLGLLTSHVEQGQEPGSEAAVQSLIRMEAPRCGARLWRNNTGAGILDNGSFVRWGLCNDSAAMNKRIKSADLIGIRKVLIKPEHVGQAIGQFVAREVKRPGWKYTGTEREQAQLNFLGLVTSFGGDARFATGEGTL